MEQRGPGEPIRPYQAARGARRCGPLGVSLQRDVRSERCLRTPPADLEKKNQKYLSMPETTAPYGDGAHTTLRLARDQDTPPPLSLAMER